MNLSYEGALPFPEEATLNTGRNLETASKLNSVTLAIRIQQELYDAARCGELTSDEAKALGARLIYEYSTAEISSVRIIVPSAISILGNLLNSRQIKDLGTFEPGWIYQIESKEEEGTEVINIVIQNPTSPQIDQLPDVFQNPFAKVAAESLMSSRELNYEALVEFSTYASYLILQGGAVKKIAINELKRTGTRCWEIYENSKGLSLIRDRDAAAGIIKSIIEVSQSYVDDIKIVSKEERIKLYELINSQKEKALERLSSLLKLSPGDHKSLLTEFLALSIDIIENGIISVQSNCVNADVSKALNILNQLKEYESFINGDGKLDTSMENSFVLPHIRHSMMLMFITGISNIATSVDLKIPIDSIYERNLKKIWSKSSNNIEKFIIEFFDDPQLKPLKDIMRRLPNPMDLPSDPIWVNKYVDLKLRTEKFGQVLRSINKFPLSVDESKFIIREVSELLTQFENLNLNDSKFLRGIFTDLYSFSITDDYVIVVDEFVINALETIQKSLAKYLEKIPYKKAELPKIKPEVKPVDLSDQNKIEDLIVEFLTAPFQSRKNLEERKAIIIQKIEEIAPTLDDSPENCDEMVRIILEQAQKGWFPPRGESLVHFGKIGKKAPLELSKDQKKNLDELTNEYLNRSGSPRDIQRSKEAETLAKSEKKKSASASLRLIFVENGISEDRADRIIEGCPHLALSLHNSEPANVAKGIELLGKYFGEDNIDKIIQRTPNFLTYIVHGYISEQALEKLARNHFNDIVSGKFKIKIDDSTHEISWRKSKTKPTEPTNEQINEVFQKYSPRNAGIVKRIFNSTDNISLVIRILKLNNTEELQKVFALMSDLLNFSDEDLSKLLEAEPSLVQEPVNDQESFETFLLEDLIPALEEVGVEDVTDIRKYILHFPRVIHPDVKKLSTDLLDFYKENGISKISLRDAVMANKAMILYGTEQLELRLKRLERILENHNITVEKKEILTNHSQLLGFVNLLAEKKGEDSARDDKLIGLLARASIDRGEALDVSHVDQAASLNSLILEAAILRDPINAQTLDQLLEESRELQISVRNLHYVRMFEKNAPPIRVVFANALAYGVTEAEILEYLTGYNMDGLNSRLYPFREGISDKNSPSMSDIQ